MKHATQKIVFSALITVALLMFSVPLYAQPSYNLLWSSDVNFGLTSYDTTISWDSNIYLNSFTFNSGTSITFTGLYVDEAVTEIALGCQTCNITVTQLEEDNLHYSLDGAGTSYVTYNKNVESVVLDGTYRVMGVGWTWTGDTVTVTGASSTVQINYAAAAVSPPPAASGSTGFQHPLFQYILEGDFLYFVVACYTSVLGSTFFGLIVFFVSAIVYLRTKSLFMVGLIYMLLGPTYIVLFWDFSFLPVLFTVVGLASVFVELLLVWRNRA